LINIELFEILIISLKLTGSVKLRPSVKLILPLVFSNINISEKIILVKFCSNISFNEYVAEKTNDPFGELWIILLLNKLFVGISIASPR